MSIHPNHSASQDPTDAGRGPIGVQIGRGIIQPALERLITTGNPRIGAQRLARNAAAHGIDLDLIWGVLGDLDLQQPAVRQVCMVVPGAGGTGMCFVSNPTKSASNTTQMGDEATQIEEIGASLTSALKELPKVAGGRVRLAQMLFEPDQDWTHEVCKRASMISVGTLDYLRMDFGLVERWPISNESWGEGITIRQINNLSMKTPTSDGSLLAQALERSYEDTLDCPELCGMRPMSDVIASHESTGAFDASRWWLLFKDNQPAGCCLLSHCPANESIELVYLGLGRTVQGHGLGTRLLTHALQSLRVDGPVHEVTCAVDRRNVGASKIYMRLGFKRFDARCGYVRPL